MSYLRSLSEQATLVDVFTAFPAAAVPLIEYHEALMRRPSPLTEGQRELIAAYVSCLNACDYCLCIHAVTAEAFGVPADLQLALMADLESAPVDARLRPILRYVMKLTLSPSRMTGADADAVYLAGWSDRALHDAVSVCALFNMMNRLVDGLGLWTDEDYAQMAGRRLHAGGYAALKVLLAPRAAQAPK